mmetsp:Transcript_21904/g.72363  ORF Transcript_21904/g.72363 Transcript_21904/m.72363 type:complete len:215 (-) Transcript_21904:125-769(-)
MVLKEQLLCLEALLHRFLVVDVFLAPVHHRDVPQPQRIHLPHENVSRVRPFIHQVHLRQHPQRSETVRIDHSCCVQSVRVRNVLVGSGDSEDDAVGPADEAHHHLSYELPDVRRLVGDRHHREAGQVDEAEVGEVPPEELENERDFRDPFLLACHLVCLFINHFPHLLEVRDPPLQVRELGIVLHVAAGQLNDQWTSGTDAGSSRQEVIPHYAL